uniref:Probable membrane transporter protein n=1 Tax=uncultured Thiotrichaceae bacterium TaxID=298394 RepID=A0A6S6SD59_9GAMM|nr:MAG: Probable membrane transporter protein [uncultured Thiotrichaceae bacterium]
MTDWLFVSSTGELAALMIIILLASIVRGAIGFGFSALVVASCSFWLPPASCIMLVALLEMAASVQMFKDIKGDIHYRLLLPLVLGGLSVMIGLALLTRIAPLHLQLLMGVYLATIALINLLDLKFKPSPGMARLTFVGFMAGIINGISAMGGIFIATFLNGSRMPVKDIRATMVIYFFISEIAFMIGAYINDLFSQEIFLTAAVSLIPMAIGIQMGTRLFKQLPEALLRRGVLIALVIISVLGLLKYL